MQEGFGRKVFFSYLEMLCKTSVETIFDIFIANSPYKNIAQAAKKALTASFFHILKNQNSFELGAQFVIK